MTQTAKKPASNAVSASKQAKSKPVTTVSAPAHALTPAGGASENVYTCVEEIDGKQYLTIRVDLGVSLGLSSSEKSDIVARTGMPWPKLASDESVVYNLMVCKRHAKTAKKAAKK